MEDDQPQPPESLLPYATWIEEAQRQVVVRAVTHVATHGMPGAHHFYLTFRTDLPGVTIPPRLRAQYPNEITIVLQHQYWDLKFIPETNIISVGLSFGGIPSTLVIPLGAVTAFADPSVQYGLHFNPAVPEDKPAEIVPEDQAADVAPAEVPQVVSLDAFRRRPPPKH